MKILKAYKFRLKPTKEQVAMLQQHGGNRRFVWNKLIEFSENYKKEHTKYPTKKILRDQEKILRTKFDFIKISHSQPIQAATDTLADTYSDAFKPKNIALRNSKIAKANKIENEEDKKRALAKAMNFGFPKFKKKSNMSDSIYYPQYFKIKKTRISFPKLGWISYIKHKDIKGKPFSVTITQDGNQYYVSIACRLKIKKVTRPDLNDANIVGIDLGLTTFATMSDGSTIENPRTLKKFSKKLRRQQKKLDRQELKETDKITSQGKIIKESSKNRNKQIIKIQKTYRKIRNIRKDFLHKTSHYIINKYDGIIVEDLDISGLLRKNGRAMNRSMSDASWFEFARQLQYKSIWTSKYFCKVDRYFPSTQICSRCGNKQNMKLEDRVYICSNPKCGAISGRDPNSSIVLKNEGIRILKDLNTVATTGIQVCGPTALAVGMKQKKVVKETIDA